MKTFFIYFLAVVSVLFLFINVLHITQSKVGMDFQGYLSFSNGVIGPFYAPGWEGPGQGFVYHIVPAIKPAIHQIFQWKDYGMVVVIPAFSGLLFILLGMLTSFYLPVNEGRFSFLMFHLLAGTYLILSPDFHLTYRFVSLHLFSFAFIPAAMIHFALLFPEKKSWLEKRSYLAGIPYLISLFVFIPYLYFYNKNVTFWIRTEYVIVFYVMAAYLFWIGRLVFQQKGPQNESTRVLAKYLLMGQLAAFMIPLFANLAIFLGRISFPLNFAAAVTVLFPVSVLMGTLLGQLKQSQLQLAQASSRLALGNLMAGLAHELNNPLTFIYSNLEPLRERVDRLKDKELEALVGDMEEGATRAKEILDQFRIYLHPGLTKKESIGLHPLLEKNILLLRHKWQGRVEIERHFQTDLPEYLGYKVELGRALMNILANAMDALPKKGGRIIVSTRTVGRHLELTIEDFGCGMSMAVQKRIFDPFYSTKDVGLGVGLGLPLALEIITKQGGTLKLQSQEDHGTKVTILLPLT